MTLESRSGQMVVTLQSGLQFGRIYAYVSQPEERLRCMMHGSRNCRPASSVNNTSLTTSGVLEEKVAGWEVDPSAT